MVMPYEVLSGRLTPVACYDILILCTWVSLSFLLCLLLTARYDSTVQFLLYHMSDFLARVTFFLIFYGEPYIYILYSHFIYIFYI